MPDKERLESRPAHDIGQKFTPGSVPSMPDILKSPVDFGYKIEFVVIHSMYINIFVGISVLGALCFCCEK